MYVAEGLLLLLVMPEKMSSIVCYNFEKKIAEYQPVQKIRWTSTIWIKNKIKQALNLEIRSSRIKIFAFLFFIIYKISTYVHI